MRNKIWLTVIITALMLFEGCSFKSEKSDISVRAAEAENLHNYAVDDEGGLWFWGMEIGKEAGEAQEIIKMPEHISDDVKDVSAGEMFTLILKNDGTLWGYGIYPDTGEVIEKPTQLTEDVSHISASGSYLLALDKNGVLWDWGHAEKISRPEDGAGVSELIRPKRILENAAEASASETGGLAVLNDGSLWGWSTFAGPEKLMEGVRSAAAGINISAAVDQSGGLLVWNQNQGGGSGSEGNITSLASGVSSVCVRNMVRENTGGDTVLYITEDGGLWLYGFDISSGRHEGEPRMIMSDVKSVSAGTSHIFAVTDDGNLWAWGNNANANLAQYEMPYSEEAIEIEIGK